MPGDYICRKGEVGREMFIVNSGVVEVIVDNKAVAQMKVGSYFGEISLLSVGHGGNRRTANVVSKGFSSLLVLHKTDFNAILSDYPEMKKVLKKTAEYVLYIFSKLKICYYNYLLILLNDFFFKFQFIFKKEIDKCTA